VTKETNRETADAEGAVAATGDRILRYTRWVGIVIIPFLVVASVLLYALPTRTDALFAWTINPPISAMFLACAYLGGIWFFGTVINQRQWHRVKNGFPAVFTFATLLGIATVLHWDKFHFGHISFIVWVTLYLTTPFAVLAAILLNRREDPRVPEKRDYAIPLVIRIVLAAIGLLALALGAVLFIVPQLAIDIWAWQLTPLTARVAGAILTLPGMVNVWMLVDSRWSAFRSVVQAELVSLVFITSTLLINVNSLLWARPSAPLFLGGIVFSLVAYVAFYLYCERRMRAVSASSGASSR
jgi:hypothetical protein